MNNVPGCCINIGDFVIVEGYSYTNMSGGTGLSNKILECKITKKWEDDECGWRFHAEPTNPETLKGKSKENIVYISEFGITENKTAQRFRSFITDADAKQELIGLAQEVYEHLEDMQSHNEQEQVIYNHAEDILQRYGGLEFFNP